jgi:hypothetical protein
MRGPMDSDCKEERGGHVRPGPWPGCGGWLGRRGKKRGRGASWAFCQTGEPSRFLFFYFFPNPFSKESLNSIKIKTTHSTKMKIKYALA